jgi:hypothetical protein
MTTPWTNQYGNSDTFHRQGLGKHHKKYAVTYVIGMSSKRHTTNVHANTVREAIRRVSRSSQGYVVVDVKVIK